ncbi:MAG: SDR family oxidoreductase, partial [Dehalococcoidia bacterium]|nr:SDR family oxidoreductase [Dehalococcoidia bacterium]
MDLGISGKVALVTGGSRGLGKQSALSLAKEGCKVSLCARNIDELQNVVSDLRQNGYDALGIEADVTTEQGVKKFYEESANNFGQVDIVVNNVGGTIGGRDFETTTDEDWMNTINLNLMSAVRLTILVLP